MNGKQPWDGLLLFTCVSHKFQIKRRIKNEIVDKYFLTNPSQLYRIQSNILMFKTFEIKTKLRINLKGTNEESIRFS